jgi:diguanylate cyclase (GGDEF)-like protein
MSKAFAKDKVRKSVRFQYLLAATLVSAFLVFASLLSHLYFNKISKDNTSALNLYNSIADQVSQLEHRVWQGDKSLYAIIRSSDQVDENTMISTLNMVDDKIHTIKKIKAFEKAGLLLHINNLEDAHNNLRIEVDKLLALRKDINWLYPMLPFINSTLLESNSRFDTAMQQAINETLNSSQQAYSGDIFRLLDELRNTWQLQILDFRASLVVFAGLRAKDIVQEQNVINYHLAVQEKLRHLTLLNAEGKLGIETEVAVDTMLESSTQWYSDYQDLLKIRKSNVWRSDINYIQTKIQPLQENVFDKLASLKTDLSKWSFLNTQRVEKAALQINFELWVLTAITILFMVLIYRLLAKTLLIPVKQISQSISYQDDSSENISLPQAASEEVHLLINAFNTMRRQIHHRQMALEYQSMHDSLTGLPNRALLQDRLEQAIRQADRSENEMSLLLLDLDRFKDINDTLGHPVGDRVLREIAKRLDASLRATDTVARLGGDEFAIITSYTDRSMIESLVARIVQDIERVIIIDNKNLTVGVSIGIATYPLHGLDVDTLIRHADIAMYAAKRENKNTEYYELEKDYHTADDLTLLADLKMELNKPSGQIQLYYQPQIDLITQKIVSVEALIRWNHPVHGFLPAEHIIRLAEQTGLISDLTCWVINESFTQLAQWNKPDITIAINLSVWNLQDPNLIPYINRKLDEHKVGANKVIFEITESAVMNDPNRAKKMLTNLYDMGIELAIDDYGTGFSSLAYLKLLPVKFLKIDKSFVIDMMSDENDSIIVHSTIDLAHNLGLLVVAEGVKDKETLAQLRELKCDYAQGYYIAKPLPVNKLYEWMDDYPSEI